MAALAWHARRALPCTGPKSGSRARSHAVQQGVDRGANPVSSHRDDATTVVRAPRWEHHSGRLLAHSSPEAPGARCPLGEFGQVSWCRGGPRPKCPSDRQRHTAAAPKRIGELSPPPRPDSAPRRRAAHSPEADTRPPAQQRRGRLPSRIRQAALPPPRPASSAGACAGRRPIPRHQTSHKPNPLLSPCPQYAWKTRKFLTSDQCADGPRTPPTTPRYARRGLASLAGVGCDVLAGGTAPEHPRRDLASLGAGSLRSRGWAVMSLPGARPPSTPDATSLRSARARSARLGVGGGVLHGGAAAEHPRRDLATLGAGSRSLASR